MNAAVLRASGRLLGACLLAACAAAPALAAGKLEVHFISVGQGDAALIRCPDGLNHILIDAADTRYPGSAKNYKEYVQRELDGDGKHVTVVLASHVHTDHTGSMKWLLENYPVGIYVDNGDKSEAAGWGQLENLKRKLNKSGKLKYVNGKSEQGVSIKACPKDEVALEVFSPWAHGDLSDPNDRSIVAKLVYKGVSFLFTGDAEDPAEDIMLSEMGEDTRKRLKADILKVGHHGSDTSSSMKFVMAVAPKLAVISVGDKGVGTNVGYKHPRFVTMDTYSTWFNQAGGDDRGKVWAFKGSGKTGTWKQHARPAALWMTNIDGTVVVKTDGATWQVDSQP